MWETPETNLDEHELQQLADVLRGFRVDDESIERGMAMLWGMDAARYELTEATKQRLVKMLPQGTGRMIEQ
jgi:hypothetical protein